MILILIPLQNEHDGMGICAKPLQNDHDGMGICAKHINLFSAEMIPRKYHSRWFLAIIIAVCQIQMILTLIPLQNEHDGMQICPKHKNFIQSGNDS